MGKTIRLEIVRGGESAPPPGPVPKKYIGFRGRHWIQEGGREVAYLGAPAVIPPSNAVALPMTREIQLMSYALQVKVNPLITKKIWHSLHDHARAMTNKGAGFDYPDPSGNPVPLRDYVNGTNLTAAGLPKYDKAQREFQGSFMRGMLGYSVMQTLADGYQLLRQMTLAPRSLAGKFHQAFTALGSENVILCTPGLHGIDATKPVLDTPEFIQEVLDKVFYVVAVTAGSAIYNFPQGQGGWVVYPFIFDRVISFPLAYFAPWESDELPDPTRAYV